MRRSDDVTTVFAAPWLEENQDSYLLSTLKKSTKADVSSKQLSSSPIETSFCRKMHFRSAHMLVFMALFLTLAPLMEVDAGHGCWKLNSDECNDHCIENKRNNCGGKCEGFLNQVCTCYKCG
uniref:Invertebrate defensins family profile domain-containing protein n=1 Tax=Plectus sambesii TaxID=2011161 RepID=A0A914W9F3_9BILA